MIVGLSSWILKESKWEMESGTFISFFILGFQEGVSSEFGRCLSLGVV